MRGTCSTRSNFGIRLPAPPSPPRFTRIEPTSCLHTNWFTLDLENFQGATPFYPRNYYINGIQYRSCFILPRSRFPFFFRAMIRDHCDRACISCVRASTVHSPQFCFQYYACVLLHSMKILTYRVLYGSTASASYVRGSSRSRNSTS